MRFHRFKNVRYPEQPSGPQESQGCERTEPLPSGAAAVGCGPKRVEAAGGYLSLSPCPSGVLFSRWYPPNNLHGMMSVSGCKAGPAGSIITHAATQVHWIRMNRLFVAKYTGSHDEVEADDFIPLQLIGGDPGVLVHCILLAQCPLRGTAAKCGASIGQLVHCNQSR